MNWLKQNLNVGHVIIIALLIAGWVGQAYVSNYKQGIFAQEVLKLSGVEIGEIGLNTDYRKQGHSFTEANADELVTAYAHAINKDVHMPYSEKVKIFVPRTEFDDVKEDVKELKQGQKDIMKLLLERLPK